MNNRYTLALTLMSLVAMPSCTDASKQPAQAEAREEIPAKSVANPMTYGRVFDFGELIKRGGNAQNDQDVLKQTLENNSSVVLDFFAEWCGPCKHLSPVLDELAKQYTDVLFVKINAEDYRSVSSALAVQGYPTLFFYKDGKLVERSKGSMSKSDLKKTLKKLN